LQSTLHLKTTGSAPDLLWVVGKSGHTVVQGRRRVRAPLPVPAAIAGA
jgi:hypothetical protein